MELLDQYAYAVYEEMSFTEAAKKLFISQPALSAALARHEKALGFAIFNRKVSPIKLTNKGRIYIESLAKIRSIEATRNLRIHEVSNVDNCSLSIGCSCSAAYFLLPKILLLFNERYPEFTVQIDLGSVSISQNLHQKLKAGKIDCFIDAYRPYADCTASFLKEEKLLAAVPNRIDIPEGLKEYALTYQELFLQGQTEKRVKETALFQDIPFIRYQLIENGMSQKMQDIIGDYKIAPFYLENIANNLFHHYMVREGVGAVFTTEGSAKHFFSQYDDISYFLFDHEKATRNLYLFQNPLFPQSVAMTAFMEIATEVCANQL